MKLEQIRENSLNWCALALDVPLLVGVSGGPDSFTLLDALARLGFPLVAAHFDHRLRPHSECEAEVVSQAAARAGAQFVAGSGDVAAHAAQARLSIEDAARDLRYRFLFEQARHFSAQAVAVGHNADDQVETVVMHLLRGAGLHGLRGMAFRTLLPTWDPQIPLVRPLLSFWREEILAYCAERQLQPIQDPTNQETLYLRNRLRHELIPLLDELQPQARQNIYRAALALAGDEAIVEAAVAQVWEACLARQDERAVFLNLGNLQQLAPGLLRGVLRRAFAILLPGLVNVDFAAVERAVAFVRSPGSGQIDLVRGVRLFVESGHLVIAGSEDLVPLPTWLQMGAEELALPVSGVLDLGNGWKIATRRLSVEDFSRRVAGTDQAWEAWLDEAALVGALKVRRARPGDRFQPLGMEGHSLKLSDFWVNHKLPRRARAAWPLVVDEAQIVWIPGFRPAHICRVSEQTHTVLHLRVEKA
jgi:tRNA(Ile)-lysidine synthase